MIDYSNTTCPVCKEKFSDEARPLICPDCGAPYHRACWDKTGHCLFESAHKGGFVWSQMNPVTENSEQNQPENSEQKTEDGFYNDIKEALDKMGFFEQAGETISDERVIFGVSEKEIVHFQGMVSPIRVLKYRRIAEGRKISLNIFAGLLIPYYIFYSRMRAAGAAAALAAFLLSLPGTLTEFFTLSGFTSPFTSEQLAKAGSSLFYIYFAFRIALALFFDYFYLLWMAGRIKRIRHRFAAEVAIASAAEIDLAQGLPPAEEIAQGEDYYKQLQDAGKPSLLYTLLDSLAIYAALTLLLYLILYTFLG